MSSENNLSINSLALRRRTLLGLYLMPTREGIVIQNVDPTAPVAETDLRPGDRLKSVDGNKIGDTVTLLDWQRNLQQGQEVRLMVDRQEQEVCVSFYPGPVPLEEAEGTNRNEYTDFTIDGVRLRSLFTYSSTADAGKDQSLPGVLILPGLGGIPCDHPGPGGMIRDIAQRLAQQGALVMRYDQRGAGDSEGSIYADIDFLTEVEDAKKALEVLSKHPRCNSKNLHLVGLSLGGLIIPLAAGGNPQVKRVCMWGSLARPWVNYALENSFVQAKLRRFPKDQVVNIQNLCSLLLGLVAVTEMSGEDLLKNFPAFKELGLTEKYLNTKVLSFWRQLSRTNIKKAYEKCAFRLLALRGEYDALSHEQDLQSIVNAAQEAGLKAARKTISGLDHFCNAGSSMPDCFNRLLQGRLSYQPEPLLDLITDWLLKAKTQPT